MVVVFFFFKQKTAYEMRISDWSSDVCSSDLLLPSQGQKGRLEDREVERLLLEREIEMAEGGIRRRSTNADDAPVAVRQDTGMTVEGDTRCRGRPVEAEDRKSVVSGKSVSGC